MDLTIDKYRTYSYMYSYMYLPTNYSILIKERGKADEQFYIPQERNSFFVWWSILVHSMRKKRSVLISSAESTLEQHQISTNSEYLPDGRHQVKAIERSGRTRLEIAAGPVEVFIDVRYTLQVKQFPAPKPRQRFHGNLSHMYKHTIIHT